MTTPSSTPTTPLPKVSLTGPAASEGTTEKPQSGAKPKSHLTEEQREQLARCSMYQFLRGADEEHSKSEDPLVKREQFAVSLRKQRKHLIISSKRKKTLDAIYEKQNSLLATAPSNQIPVHLQTQHGMESAIYSISHLLNEPAQLEHLLSTLRGMRNISAMTDVRLSDAFNTLIQNPTTLTQLVAVLGPSVSKQKIVGADERKLRIAILCEALWTLNNLAVENVHDIELRLFEEHNIYQILQAHLLENFIEDVDASEQPSPFTQPAQALQDHELELLKEILWLLSNLANNDAVAFTCASQRLAEQLHLITRAFHTQFTFDLWRIVIWNLRMTSSALSLFEPHQIDASPYFDLLMAHTEVICSHLLVSETVEGQAARMQMKKDFIFVLSSAFLYFTDEEKQAFATAPYRVARTIATLMAQVAGSDDLVKACLRVLGDLICESDEVCSYLVRTEQLRFLSSLQQAIVSSGSNVKEAVLWILSNVVLNSLDDLNAVLASGIIAHVAIACRHAVRGVKKEALYMLANLIVKLSDEGQASMIQSLLLQYDIEASLFDVLKNGWSAPENQQVALMTYESLFKSDGQIPESTVSDGHRYRQKFINQGGLEALEELQEHGKRELYELAHQLMTTYFPEQCEVTFPEMQEATAVKNPEFVFRI